VPQKHPKPRRKPVKRRPARGNVSAPPISEVLDSVASAMATDPRDWSLVKRDAWLYGIFLGWGRPAMREVADLHQWSPETVARLENYRSVISIEQRKAGRIKKKANAQT
jgi:hypothetical protein